MKKEDLKKYLEEELSGAEKHALEKKLADDPFFSEGLEGLRQWKADTGQPFDELSAALDKQVDEAQPTAERVIRMPWVRLVLIAASLAGICFFSLQYFFNARDTSEKIFAAYFKPLSHPDMTVRGEDTSISQTEPAAVRSYEHENYKQAIYYYKAILEKQPDNEKHMLFLGISYLANHQPELAIGILNKGFAKYPEFENDRNWYLALAYLRVNNTPATKSILQELKNGDSYYKEMAAGLLKELH
jgi:tetratricopeptide (TPR) repeat protein